MALAKSDIAAHIKKSSDFAGPRHNCGIAAFYFHTPAPLSTLIPALTAVNHRGQEGLGVVGINADGTMRAYRDKGLVRDRVDNILAIDGPVRIAIGHDRYSTSGDLAAWQPFSKKSDRIVTAHNGNLTNPLSLLQYISSKEQGELLSDTHTLHKALNADRGADVATRLQKILPSLQGAFSLIIADKKTQSLYLVRDPWGFRPLHYAPIHDGRDYMIASETAAFHHFVKDLDSVKEVLPGQCLKIDSQGITEIPIDFPKVNSARCIFELVYIGYPVSEIFGVQVAEFRRACGEDLAQIDIDEGFIPDLIVPIRDSGAVASEGYSRAMIKHLVKKGSSPEEIAKRVPHEAVIRSNYVDRTFILPHKRRDAVTQKFTVNAHAVRGKNLVIIDDSVVRGTTIFRLVEMIRDAGAASVHVRSASPPIRHGCYYGVDFTGKDNELVAMGKTEKEIAKVIGADSIRYLDLKHMVAIAEKLSGRRNGFCTACFSGKYPVKIDEKLMLGKEC